MGLSQILHLGAQAAPQEPSTPEETAAQEAAVEAERAAYAGYKSQLLQSTLLLTGGLVGLTYACYGQVPALEFLIPDSLAECLPPTLECCSSPIAYYGQVLAFHLRMVLVPLPAVPRAFLPTLECFPAAVDVGCCHQLHLKRTRR